MQEVYSKTSITHMVGNPNLQLHLVVNNSRGRKVKVKSIEATLLRNEKELIKLPVQNYLHNQNDKDTLLFTAFLANW